MRLLVILCVVAMMSLTGSAIAQQALDFSTVPTWSAGDTWTFRSLAGPQASYTVLAPSADGYTVKYTSPNGAENLVEYDKNLLSPASFQPFTFFWHPQWPLVPDAKPWTFTITGTSIGGPSTTWDTTEQVQASESVTVPAGTFQAVRIHGHQCSRNDGCGDFDIWYAPQVKFFVKIVLPRVGYWGSGGVEELLSYQLH